MRISDYYNLSRTQPYLDFVDVRLETDVPVFVDPKAIKMLLSPWGHACASLLQSFFETVLKCITRGQNANAQILLSSLNERNEFHLGYSQNRSRGHGFGTITAESVWGALSESRASISGLLKDLEDTCLLIHGIGPDMISDAVCNIIRGPLIDYTQKMCDYYGIPMQPQVDSGPIWNACKDVWERKLIPLPVTTEGKLIFVPKIIVRHQLMYKYNEYYRYYLLPVMQTEELNANTALVEVLKDGRHRVTKKALMGKYGADKLAVVTETVKRPHVLREYKKNKEGQKSMPLTHDDLADIENTDRPDWISLLKEIRKLPSGNETAPQYEELIEKLFSSLFYSSLFNPMKQHQIHNGRKRIDITYTNEAKNGFFAWTASHYPCALIFVECKNYGKEVANPELDQISGRFSPNRGKIGLLVCREIQNKKLFLQRCIDTAKDGRGYIIPLDDEDLQRIIEDQLKCPDSQDFPHLKKLFIRLIE